MTSTPPIIAKFRQDAIDSFMTGVAAADPYQAMQRHLAFIEGQLAILQIDGNYRQQLWDKIYVLAVGKAAIAMAKAAKDIIPAWLLVEPIIVVTHDNQAGQYGLDNIELWRAGHPLPDERGLIAAQRCAAIASHAKANQLVLALISGGGSALLPLPVATISLADKIMTTQLLLASGANINQINCVRKHLSQLKGGGLAKLAYPAALHALILSDVLGDDVSSIASGSTVPDPSTYTEALAILESLQLSAKVPTNVLQHLKRGQQGEIVETPKPGDPIFTDNHYTVVGSNAVSLAAVKQFLQANGYSVVMYNPCLTGEARLEAAKLVSFAKTAQQPSSQRPMAIIAGGETTVTLQGNGRGGRNQEMALAFAIYAEQQGLAGNWVFLSGGTDGRDGPTDAAGGVVDNNTLLRLHAAGITAMVHLADNDSYTALAASHDLLVTGATGTNVADLQILLLQ
jgi:glycerate 2-kinase